jgi:hypothetical protein
MRFDNLCGESLDEIFLFPCVLRKRVCTTVERGEVACVII